MLIYLNGDIRITKEPLTNYLDQYKICANGLVVGSCTIFFISSYLEDHVKKEIRLADLCIAPNERNKGYGTMLIKGIYNYLSDKGYKILSLWVEKDNLNAQRLYKRFGFIQTSIDHTNNNFAYYMVMKF